VLKEHYEALLEERNPVRLIRNPGVVYQFIALMHLIFTICREKNSKYVEAANECQVPESETQVSHIYLAKKFTQDLE
jgi:hypothetical protein